MKQTEIMKILADTAYVRTGGSEEELKTAQYLKEKCQERGLQAEIVPFPVDMATMQEAVFYADGVEIPCKGYMCAGSGEIEAPFYYLRNTDPYSLSQCKGKIVMFDGSVVYWKYQDLLANGAVGFVTYSGDANYANRDIDQRELRSYICEGNKILGVSINTKDAIALVKKGTKTAKIKLQQDEYVGKSHNVVLDMPGEVPQYIVLTAHYDSTSLSQGVYDNMSGAVGILGVAEYFAKRPHRYGLRFIWCGSEERGLLGAKAYCAEQGDKLKDVVLNINVDMIGSIMGKFIACCTTEEALVQYIKYFSDECGFAVNAYQDVYSSDSTPFADKGVPALSFARLAPAPTAKIHTRYDTIAVMAGKQMAEDIRFIISFTERMANAKHCPVAREIPDNMKEKLDIYLSRKRDKK